MKSMILCVFTVVIMATTMTVGWAAPATVNAEVYRTRLAELEKATQEQVAALAAQIEATKDVAANEKLAREAMELKRSAEVTRLEILLEWARTEGDEARIAEVQTALDNWKNPPQPKVLPQVERQIPTRTASPTPDNQNNR